jgi:hypothetical protein
MLVDTSEQNRSTELTLKPQEQQVSFEDFAIEYQLKMT